MTINSVSSSHNATAQATTPPPAKKSNVSFADLMAGSQRTAQPVQQTQPAASDAGTTASLANKA